MHKEGGAHPNEQKGSTDTKPIVEASVPKMMIYPMSMHIGAPAEPIVEVGDQVKVGQMIAKEGGFVSAHVYSSVSGIVTAIESRLQAGGSEVESIIIKKMITCIQKLILSLLLVTQVKCQTKKS